MLRLVFYDIRQYPQFLDTQYLLVASIATSSILTASTDDAVHRTGSLFDSAEKSEYRIPPLSPQEILARPTSKSR